jgi:hypothetical protein
VEENKGQSKGLGKQLITIKDIWL